MKDDSPIVLHIDVGDTTYEFFLFSIMVYDIIIYDNEFDHEAPMPTVSDSSNDVFDTLQNLFVNAKQEDGGVALNLIQLMILLSIVDNVSKALLKTGADKLIDYLPSSFPGLMDDWVTGYLQNAGYIFDSFRQQFGGSPKMDALLNRITSINTWKE